MADPASLPTISENQLRIAVQGSCDCGGGGPDTGCGACRVWHWLQDSPRKQRRVSKDELHAGWSAD